MNFFNILFAEKTNNAGANSRGLSYFEELFAAKLKAMQEVLVTIIGNPLNFLAKKAQTAKSTKVTLSPVQAGSGDPSPTNIRPILGRSSVEIKGCGKNLWDETTYPLTENRYVNANTGALSSSNGFGASAYIPCEFLQGKTITLNQRPSGSTPGFAFYSDKSVSSYISGEKNDNETSGEPWTVTVPNTAKYMRFTTLLRFENVQIELGSSASSYESYQESNDVTITFGETVYSGTLDVEQGQVLVDKEYVDFSTITINKNNNDPTNWNYYLRKSSFSYSKNMICSHLTYSRSIPATSIGLSSRDTNRAIYMNFLDAIEVNDASHFRQFCIDNNVQLLCERTNPLTITLTTEQIQILKGQNSIWLDDEGAQIELSYMN